MRVSSPHAELAATLAAELGTLDRDGLGHGLDALACRSGSLLDRHFVAHEEVSPWLLDPATGELVDARTLPPDPYWRCAHEVADVLLIEAQRRCERDGDLTRALRAAALRCALAFDEVGREQAAAALNRLRARLI